MCQQCRSFLTDVVRVVLIATCATRGSLTVWRWFVRARGGRFEVERLVRTSRQRADKNSADECVRISHSEQDRRRGGGLRVVRRCWLTHRIQLRESGEQRVASEWRLYGVGDSSPELSVASRKGSICE